MADRRRDTRPPPSGRSNEYFVPKDGIDREVITADICRYLGNDALVRPGIYENPQTRARQEGYFINAYRNLTSAMIADLKADSARWEQERSQSASRSNGSSMRDSDGTVRLSNSPIVGYKNSQTHESRQYYGPTESPHPPAGYVTSAPIGNSQTVYDSRFQSQQPSYAQPPAGYGAQPQYVSDTNYYVSGAHMEVDGPARQQQQRPNVPVSGPSVPGTNTGYAQPRTVFPEEQQRGTYYSQTPVSSAQQYSSQPTDANYGRGAYNHQPSSSIHLQDRELSNFSAPVSVPASYQQAGPPYDSEYPPDPRYQTQGGYSQPPMDGSYSPATANPRRNDRDRDPDPRDSRRRHHGR